MANPKKEFKIDDYVYLKSDPEQHLRLIIGISDYGVCKYIHLACGTEITEHFEHEICRRRNNKIFLGLDEKEVPEN